MRVRQQLSRDEFLKNKNEAIAAIKKYIDNLTPVVGPFTEKFIKARTSIAAKIFNVLNLLAPNLPDRNVLNVASLMNCMPDDFLAMKLFCDRKYGKGKYLLNYFTFHPQQKELAWSQHVFQKFPELRCISCDPTDKAAMTAAMLKAGVCEQGFDLILLRHTQFHLVVRGTYVSIIQDVIPYIAARNAKVIFTFHNDNEKALDMLKNVVNKPYIALQANQIELNFGFLVKLSQDEIVEPDTFTVLLGCKGRAFDNKLLARSQAPSPLVRLSAVATQMPQAHAKLLQEIRDLNTKHKIPEKNAIMLLKTLLRAEYNKALRMMCGDVLVNHVQTLLKYHYVLKINVNEIPGSGKSALDRLNESKLGQQAQKDEILDMLIVCGLVSKPTLAP